MTKKVSRRFTLSLTTSNIRKNAAKLKEKRRNTSGKATLDCICGDEPVLLFPHGITRKAASQFLENLSVNLAQHHGAVHLTIA